MFPLPHLNYIFVTKIPRMLILYFTFFKNKDNSFEWHCCHLSYNWHHIMFFCSLRTFPIVSSRLRFLLVSWPLFVPLTVLNILSLNNYLSFFSPKKSSIFWENSENSFLGTKFVLQKRNVRRIRWQKWIYFFL